MVLVDLPMVTSQLGSNLNNYSTKIVSAVTHKNVTDSQIYFRIYNFNREVEIRY